MWYLSAGYVYPDIKKTGANSSNIIKGFAYVNRTENDSKFLKTTWTG